MISLEPRLTLDSEHVYRVDGQPVVSVTQVLKMERLIDSRYFSPEAAQRGVAVHAAVEQDDTGVLEEAFLDPRVGDYLEGWRRFRHEKGFTPKMSEIRMFSRSLHLAGTADSVGTMDGIRGLVLVDVKTGAPSPATSLQTAAYGALLHESNGEVVAARFAVQVTADGTFYLHRYPDMNDYLTFRAVLQTHRWRARNLPSLTEHLESEAA